MKALYRRYRPMRLKDVIGQDQVIRPLESALKAGKVGHAYLFVGPRGCGKTSVARILAHEVNGFKYELEDDYVDIVEIDGASNRGIDNIRELREKAAIAPTSGKYKVYIVDEVHMLTKEAFNALLKTLEEPPAHVIFIMATTDAYKVPVTITSRAQTYTFKLADIKVMQEFLKSVAEKEKIPISDAALEIVAKRGGGSFRDSLSLLDQISTLSDSEITKELVVTAMGLPEDEKIAELLESYAHGDVVKITTMLKDLLASGVKAETLTEEMIGAIIAAPRSELMPLLVKLPDVKAPYAEAKLLVALFNNARRGETKSINTEKPKNDTTNNNVKSEANHDFKWDEFLSAVRGESEAIYMKLSKAKFEISEDGVEIYPSSGPAYKYLSKDNIKAILAQASGGTKVTVHEAGEAPKNAEKDATLAKISDIMGGEVINDGGGSPF